MAIHIEQCVYNAYPRAIVAIITPTPILMPKIVFGVNSSLLNAIYTQTTSNCRKSRRRNGTHVMSSTTPRNPITSPISINASAKSCCLAVSLMFSLSFTICLTDCQLIFFLWVKPFSGTLRNRHTRVASRPRYQNRE